MQWFKCIFVAISLPVAWLSRFWGYRAFSDKVQSPGVRTFPSLGLIVVEELWIEHSKFPRVTFASYQVSDDWLSGKNRTMNSISIVQRSRVYITWLSRNAELARAMSQVQPQTKRKQNYWRSKTLKREGAQKHRCLTQRGLDNITWFSS